jgi:hypothetical protein
VHTGKRPHKGQPRGCLAGLPLRVKRLHHVFAHPVLRVSLRDGGPPKGRRSRVEDSLPESPAARGSGQIAPGPPAAQRRAYGASSSRKTRPWCAAGLPGPWRSQPSGHPVGERFPLPVAHDNGRKVCRRLVSRAYAGPRGRADGGAVTFLLVDDGHVVEGGHAVENGGKTKPCRGRGVGAGAARSGHPIWPPNLARRLQASGRRRRLIATGLLR